MVRSVTMLFVLVAVAAALLIGGPVLSAASVAASDPVCAAEGQRGGEPGGTAALSEAQSAFKQHDLDGMRGLLEEAVEKGLRPADCAEAHRWLALLEWRYERDAEGGRAHLKRAFETGADRSQSYAELSRLELALGRFDRAREAAHRALRAAEGEDDRIRGVARLAEAALERIREDQWPDGRGLFFVSEAHRHLTPVVAANPGLLEPARLQLVTALLLDDAPAALEAWRSYYVSALDRDGPLPDAHRLLQEVLPRWKGAHTAKDDRRKAVLALSASAMYDAAALVALDPRVLAAHRIESEPEIREVAAYADFLRRTEGITNEYYRRTALAVRDTAADRVRFEEYRDRVMSEAEALWSKLDWNDKPPAFDSDSVNRELEQRFRAEFFFGRVGGYLDLHYGHRMIDERHTAEQYGHTAEVRFVSLDGIVSNGFQTWAWDERSGHGGWGNEEMIVQIRPRYAGGGLRAWQVLTDSVEAAKMREKIAEETLADSERAPENSCPYLPGLAERIRMQGFEQLRDSLRAQGFEGDALRLAFLRAIDEARVGSSIFAHEGRHAIDNTIGFERDQSEDLEYRAKLSEVAFAPVPRLALGSIISPNIGGEGRHGRANARIMCDLVDWIEAHSTEIGGLDASGPLLPQLDRLTDEQLREAFRSFDPLASGNHSKE